MQQGPPESAECNDSLRHIKKVIEWKKGRLSQFRYIQEVV